MRKYQTKTAKHVSKKKSETSDPRQTPNLAPAASAATYNSPFCPRFDLVPKAPKAKKKNRTCTADFKTLTGNKRVY